MDTQLALILALAFIIHLIGTLAYSVRIAGVRTRRIAVSFALFNVLVLVSRTSNSFQGPFLAKPKRAASGTLSPTLSKHLFDLLKETEVGDKVVGIKWAHRNLIEPDVQNP